jgi:hypothetical protein
VVVERVQLSIEESSGSCSTTCMISEVEGVEFCLCNLAAVSLFIWVVFKKQIN